MKIATAVRGLAVAMAGSPLAYALTQCFERRNGPTDDPAGIIWVEHSTFLGRLVVVSFTTGLLSLGAMSVDARWPARTPALFCVLAVASCLATACLAITLR